MAGAAAAGKRHTQPAVACLQRRLARAQVEAALHALLAAVAFHAMLGEQFRHVAAEQREPLLQGGGAKATPPPRRWPGRRWAGAGAGRKGLRAPAAVPGAAGLLVPKVGLWARAIPGPFHGAAGRRFPRRAFTGPPPRSGASPAQLAFPKPHFGNEGLKAIVAVARQLAVDLWRWQTGQGSAEQLGLQP